MQIAVLNNPVWTPYLFDYWGNCYSDQIIRFEKKNWFVKYFPRDSWAPQRESLAYLLGRKISNIAEIRKLQETELAAIRRSLPHLPPDASLTNTYLVRLAFDYKWLQLPVKDLDAAVAAELVFSLWIRRRDAHSFNRIYIRDIPVFFDHLTGLLGEPELIDLEKFFFPGPDAGYAAWWQLEEKCSMASPDILRIRTYEKELFHQKRSSARVYHQVRRRSKVQIHLLKMAKRIQKISPFDLKSAATAAGFPCKESAEIINFLRESQSQLDVGVQRLCDLFDIPNSHLRRDEYTDLLGSNEDSLRIQKKVHHY